MLRLLSRIKQNFFKRWKWIVALVVVLAIVGYWGYSRATTEPEQLTFVKPTRGVLVKTLEVNGRVEAKDYARLRFAGGGKVTRITAKEGDWVKKGQTIATVDIRSLQKTLQKDLNDFTKERLDWDTTLESDNATIRTPAGYRETQKDQLDLNNMVLDVEISDIAISNGVLSAPFDGILVTSPTNVVGTQLLASDAFEIVNPGSLYFQAQIDELDMGSVQPSLQAQIKLDSYPDQTFESSIKFISYTSRTTTTSTVFLAELPLPNPDINTFRIGMNGDATIMLETKENVLSIPLDATIDRDGATFVKVRKNDRETEERQIQIGLETEDYVEVTSGLSEQDEILLPE